MHTAIHWLTIFNAVFVFICFMHFELSAANKKLSMGSPLIWMSVPIAIPKGVGVDWIPVALIVGYQVYFWRYRFPNLKMRTSR